MVAGGDRRAGDTLNAEARAELARRELIERERERGAVSSAV
jgi:hypothetical protein